MHKLHRVRFALQPHHVFWAEMMLSLFFSVLIFAPVTSAANVVRLNQRSLMMSDPNPGAIASYNFSFTYNSQTTIGSVDLLFCVSPIPDDPCYAPVGLDVTGASLASQTGEIGYHLLVVSSNHLRLERATPAIVNQIPSSYKIAGIKNSTDVSRPFAVRLGDYASSNGSGPVIDLGSVVNGLNNGVVLETQVKPLLLFCQGKQVSLDCSDVSGGNFSDFGDLSTDSPLTAQSQMAVGTNASSGFVITVNGTTMLAGNRSIPAPIVPTASIPGANQFGLNLVANTQPTVGSDPDGDFTNAVPGPTYAQPNKYMFRDGDIIASAPNVSLVRRFTVSYIVNASPELKAGVYSTTLTYVCSGRF